ncbi:dihydrolipoamide acetyltransferase family protein [Sinomonas flava]|uniref:dihydrolipoamide acetyltransferase family protein n=1 Tax=Sinomonas flava TaxID=496857 RepID=UPI0039A5BA45
MAETVIREFRLPDLGEGLTESEIVAWRVSPGDTVSLNQVIAEVETAKAVVELPSPYSGRVARLLAEPGTIVAVGTPIVAFEVAAEAARPTAGGSQGAAAKPKREPNLVGYGAAIEDTGRPARKTRAWSAPRPAPGEPDGTEQAHAPEPEAAHEPEPEAAPEPRAAERPRSTPPVRKLAKDLGIDLESLTGTGTQGLITRDDVLAAAGTPDAGAEAAQEAAGVVRPSPGERETRTPIKGVRKLTAAAMVASAFTAPHASEFLTVDVTASMELLARLRENRAYSGLKVTPLTLVAKAVLVALKRNPSLNSHWDEAAQEIVQYHYVNLGIAAATPRGLVVPNVKDAQDLTLPELAEAIAALAQNARDGRPTPEELSGGTISITNIGVFGIDAGTPILNPGEAAIVAMGQVRRLPWEFHGEVVLREVMTLSLSFDHRLVDGEQASRFLADLGAILADPGLVITMV